MCARCQLQAACTACEGAQPRQAHLQLRSVRPSSTPATTVAHAPVPQARVAPAPRSQTAIFTCCLLTTCTHRLAGLPNPRTEELASMLRGLSFARCKQTRQRLLTSTNSVLVRAGKTACRSNRGPTCRRSTSSSCRHTTWFSSWSGQLGRAKTGVRSSSFQMDCIPAASKAALSLSSRHFSTLQQCLAADATPALICFRSPLE